MRILFDIVHPAHVHFFKHMVRGLQAKGHSTMIVARQKDVTCELLDHYGFEYVCVGRAGRKSRAAQLAELVNRDWTLWKLSRKFRPDVIMTRNPAGVQAARLAGAVGIFDTDDGRAAGIHFRAAAPFAHVITTPDCLNEYYGPRHIKYPGYKQSAYLHPDHFEANSDALDLLGVKPGEMFFLVRFVEMSASHDSGESGLTFESKAEIIRRLSRHGRVFITSESELPDVWQPMQISIPAHRMHDVLAQSSLFIGDSQTMAAEAAMLGVPNLRASTFVGRISYLEELEHRYGLTFGFHPRNVNRLLEKLDEMLQELPSGIHQAEAHTKMLAEKANVSAWFIDNLEKLLDPPRSGLR